MNVFLLSMGCAKNTVDSERLAGRLASLGYRVVEEPEEAQVGIVNTCGFIQDAVKENVDAILDLEQMKDSGMLKHIVVAGCLVNRYEKELRQELPSVDLFARSEDWDAVADFLAGIEGKRDLSGGMSCGRMLLPLGTPWSRLLKVSEGCDSHCSYCAIPGIRGPLRSAPVEALVEEALTLYVEGAREICLVGQDLTVYGQDLYGEPSLRRLISELDRELPKGTWLRLLYLHPERVTRDLADFLMGASKVLHYLDIPIQHINDEILARMNRSPHRAGGRHIRDIFRYIREADPLFALRTTLMTGFPGETESQFDELLDFLEEAELDRAGAFIYSPEEGTPAADFPNTVPQDVSEERCARLMELQSGISQRRGELFIGRELDVLIEEADPEEDTAWGRSYRDAPEVDGLVCVSGVGGAKPGEVLRARAVDCEERDLFAEFVAPASPAKSVIGRRVT